MDMRNYFLILSYFLLTGISFSQNLQSIIPALNSGGYINDVWEDTLNNKIYIAGNFTTVNGNARKNIARFTYNPVFNSFVLDSWAPVTSMLGEIKCIAKYNNDMHFGGDFTSVNGNATISYWGIITITPAAVSGFQPDVSGSIFEINDFETDGSYLYVAGKNAIYDGASDYRTNFGKFILTSGGVTVDTDPAVINPSFNWGGTMECVRLHLDGNKIYLCGKGFGGTLNDGIVAFDKNTMAVISSFNPSFTFEQVIDCETYSDKVIIVNSKIWHGGESVLVLDENTGALQSGAVDASSGGTPYSIAVYKDYLFIAGMYNFLQGISEPFLGSVSLSGNIPYPKINWSPLPNAGFDNRYALHRWKNRLYASDNNLTTISSATVADWAVYCLEPYDPVLLTVATASACQLQSFNYTIQSVPYATGYTWWYSGSDVTITGNPNATVTLNFGENATSGILYVAPYSKCNLYSDTLAFAITVNPLPNADAGIDSTLNCLRLQLDLQGNSITNPVNYLWNGPFGFSSSLPNPTITLDGEYVLTVTNTSTGCMQKDTVLITQDTITPNVTTPVPPFILTCTDTTVFLNGISTTNPSSFYWRKQTTGTVYSNPFYADSIGAYFLVVTNTRNGCKDSNYVVVTENRMAPQIEITSHAGIMTLTLDTLTCTKDTLLFYGNSITANTVFHWEDTSGIINNNDSLYISQTGSYIFVVTDTINGCFAQQNFFVDEYKTPPQIQLPAGLTDITCSRDTIVLDGNAISSNTNINWSGPENFSSPDPAVADTTGYFVLTGINTLNGCVISDSVLVAQIPLIETEISNDTLVCSGSNVNLEVIAIGNLTSLTYLWTNTTQTTSALYVNPLVTTEYIVTVTDGNCTGKDSVSVYISPEINIDSILSFASCASDTGQIQIYVQGGIDPYQYSVDGILFQTSNTFILPFGEYEITIKDSLGCVHTDSAFINENSQLPEPDFLVSTYSFIEDTIVLVNISNPQPDSLEWVFPTGTAILLNDIETPWIILPDTGMYQITLKGYFGNCFSEKIKTIYVRETDTSVANFYNENGIDTLVISPNPNNGIFDLEIIFHRKQDFSVLIYDLNGNLQWSDVKNEEDYYLNNVQLGSLQNGTYLIRVIAEFDAVSTYFIIQH
jgi:hypothetical protein